MSSTELVVVDTNVLLGATDRARPHHAAARALLTEDRRDLAVSPQIVREYLAATSRPIDANGLGLDPDRAAANISHLLRHLRLLEEDGRTTARLLDLVASGHGAGRQVHDANIVAVALAHRAAAVVTDDVRHFVRFADLIRIEHLRAGSGDPADDLD